MKAGHQKKAWRQTVGRLKQYYPHYGFGVICGLFGRSRQAHYKQNWMEDKLALKHVIVVKTVELTRASMPRVGTRKLKFMLDGLLQKHGITMGRDKLFDLLSEYGFLVRRRKKRNSDHPFRRYLNLVRELVVNRLNQLWVSDITYIAMLNNYCYLSLVTDVYSRKIVGYCLYPTLERQGPLSALQMALSGAHRERPKMLIHHSDRGLQYCCRDYTDLLTKIK